MAIDYKKELESAARSMILVHEPDVLIRMIARTIVQKVKVNHAAILLHDKNRDTYILSISRGPAGLKIPAGFTRMDADNPLIRFYKEKLDKKLLGDGALIYEEAKKILKNKKLTPTEKELVDGALHQLEIYEISTSVASYFRDDLLGILLLGRKKNGKVFRQEEIDFFAALASDVAMAIRNAYLFKELEAELDRKRRLFLNTTVALAAAIDAKDHYTRGHTNRVTSLSLEIAKKLIELEKKEPDKKFLENLHIASLLHDIGKIGIPEAILNKEGPLNEEEWELIKQHPKIGLTILQPIKELEDANLGVKYHHERFDGTGYPEQLKGEQIPLIASIIGVTDAFDAMTSDRVYRKALSKEEAKNEILRQNEKQFDPRVVNAFLKVYEEGKV